MATIKSRLLLEQERLETEAALQTVKELREIERTFRSSGRTSKRALRAVKSLGWTEKPHGKYPSEHILLSDYALLLRKGLDHYEAGARLRDRYGAKSIDAVRAKLHSARAILRRELKHWESLSAEAPGGEPEIDLGDGGYSGPAPAGHQVRFLRQLLEETKGIPPRA